MVVAKRAIERRLAAGSSGNGLNPTAPILARRLRAGRARPLDGHMDEAQNDLRKHFGGYANWLAA